MIYFLPIICKQKLNFRLMRIFYAIKFGSNEINNYLCCVNFTQSILKILQL